MNVEMNEKILEDNNKMGREHLSVRDRLDLKLKKFWGKRKTIKDPKLIRKALKMQEAVDRENFEALKCFMKGRIVWQGRI